MDAPLMRGVLYEVKILTAKIIKNFKKGIDKIRRNVYNDYCQRRHECRTAMVLHVCFLFYFFSFGTTVDNRHLRNDVRHLWNDISILGTTKIIIRLEKRQVCPFFKAYYF